MRIPAEELPAEAACCQNKFQRKVLPAEDVPGPEIGEVPLNGKERPEIKTKAE